MPITNYLPSSRLIQPGVCTSSTRPASPFEGQVIYETDTDRVLVWNNSAWVDPSTGTTGRSGLAKVVSGSWSSASSNHIDNCFTSSHTNYRVLITNISVSTATDVRMQVRTGGSNKSTSDYYMGGIFQSSSSISGLNENGQTSFRGVYTGSITQGLSSLIFEIQNPALPKLSSILSNGTGWDGSQVVNRSFTGFVDGLVAYDGFRLFAGSGTFSADYSVYGYN